nr:serine/threonine protein kinase [Gammaproteobacteria bacterium]
MDAIDAAGWQTDGRVSALNSYENRVYQIGLDDGSSVVAKFYRPERWSDAAILEEHQFCETLADHDLPVVCPLATEQGDTLLQVGPFRFCLFPRAGGRPPELDNSEQLTVIGRTIARMHLVGAITPFKHRVSIGPERLGDEPFTFLKSCSLLPPEVCEPYRTLVDVLLATIHERFAQLPDIEQFSIHGDFHPGNILWGASNTPHLLDFDDI